MNGSEIDRMKELAKEHLGAVSAEEFERLMDDAASSKGTYDEGFEYGVLAPCDCDADGAYDEGKLAGEREGREEAISDALELVKLCASVEEAVSELGELE